MSSTRVQITVETKLVSQINAGDASVDLETFADADVSTEEMAAALADLIETRARKAPAKRGEV